MGRISPPAAWSPVLIGLALAGCYQDTSDCGLDHCAREKYEISTRNFDRFDPAGRSIDTLDTGQLYVEVRVQRASPLAKGSAGALSCISCEEILGNSRLHFDRPVLSGSDTLAAYSNLLDSGVVAKIGIGGLNSLLFNREVRFKQGENRISFASDIVQQGRKIGSVSLEKTLYVGEGSSW